MNLAHSVGGVTSLLEILRQDLEAGVEAVWLESLHCAPLHPCQILYHEILKQTFAICHVFLKNFQKPVNFSPNLQG